MGRSKRETELWVLCLSMRTCIKKELMIIGMYDLRDGLNLSLICAIAVMGLSIHCLWLYCSINGIEIILLGPRCDTVQAKITTSTYTSGGIT